MSSSPAIVPSPAPERLASIDAFRGFVMFLIIAEALEFAKVAAAFPGSGFWSLLATHQDHAAWVGCTLHDLIQPSFSFLVGVALPFSIASRRQRGQPMSELVLHALWRSLLLILLGVFLRSAWSKQTYWTFEDTVTQIGLGYPLLFLLAWRSMRTQWIAFAIILVGYWLAWALYPVAGPGFDFARVGVPPDWPHHATGFAAHWNKNANLGAAFDAWFLNLFPRERPFIANDGGYLTLNFIPTLATMILGLIGGQWLRTGNTPREKIRPLLVAGVAGLILGITFHALGVCPLVKRIWTPTWTLFSGGCCFLLLAAFYAVIDWRGWKRWAFPLRVIGVNSIAAYVMTWLFEEPVANQLRIHVGETPFLIFGPAFAPLLHGVVTIVIFWLILFWMYRRKLFLKI